MQFSVMETDCTYDRKPYRSLLSSWGHNTVVTACGSVESTGWMIYNPWFLCVCGTPGLDRTASPPLGVQVPSQTQAAAQGLQLLLSQPLLLLQVLLPDEQRGLGLHEAPVVLQLLGRQLAGQEGGDHVLSPVQVVLQIFGILSLFAQQTVATVQRLLMGERERETQLLISHYKIL